MNSYEITLLGLRLMFLALQYVWLQSLRHAPLTVTWAVTVCVDQCAIGCDVSKSQQQRLPLSAHQEIIAALSIRSFEKSKLAK
jgi:hypothetical protein